MAIYLGSTDIATIYLGEAGYALPNIDAVYLGSTLVWSSEPTITFTQGNDSVCSFQPSYISTEYTIPAAPGDFVLSIAYTVSDGSTATVAWEGSSDNGQTWSAISGFSGYNSVSGNNLYLERISAYEGYDVRAVVNSTPSTIHSAIDGGSVSFPPCEP